MTELINRLHAIIDDENFLTEVVADVFRKVKIDVEEEVTLTGFRMVMDHIYTELQCPTMTEVEAICMFERFDKDKNGTLSVDEIANILRNFLEYYVGVLEKEKDS